MTTASQTPTTWPGADRTPASGPHITVVVQRSGGRVTTGELDDASRWISSSARSSGRPHVDIPAFEGTDAEWKAMMSCARAQYKGLPVDLVEQAPPGNDYLMMVVGGTAAAMGLKDVWGWSTNGKTAVVPRGMGFVFSADHHPRDRAIALCESLSHEIGHMLGLAHGTHCGDLMNVDATCNDRGYERGAIRTFDAANWALLTHSLDAWVTSTNVSSPGSRLRSTATVAPPR